MESSKYKFIEKLKYNRFEKVTGLDPTEIQNALYRNGYKQKDMICIHLNPNIAHHHMCRQLVFKYHTYSKEDALAQLKESFSHDSNPDCFVEESKINERDAVYASCNIKGEDVRLTMEIVWVRTLPKFEEEYCKSEHDKGEKCLPFHQVDCFFNTKTSEKSQASCLDFVKHMEFKE